MLLKEHDGPIRADLRRYYGLSLARPGLGLMELADLVVYLPDDSATKRAIGEGWTLSEQLSALVADRLEVLIWQKTADGSKGKNPPKPIPRPGFEDSSTGRYGTAKLTRSEAEKWMASRRARRLPPGTVEHVTASGERRVVTARQAAYWARKKAPAN